MKKIILLFVVTSLIIAGGLTGCTSGGNNTKGEAPNNEGTTDTGITGEISVVSREDGSGTRGAFIELLGIEVKSDDGSKKDMTTKEAIIANKTDVMLSNIASDPKSIGYVSLGSLNNTIKALKIDGVEATSDNVKNGSYPVVRPFMIATNDNLSATAQDFIDFILSKEGQEVVAGGYISIEDNAPGYEGSNVEGKITVAGSSSVTPIMEKLKEAYIAINPNVQIDVQMSDSTSGMTSAIDGTCDIGMASRELKDSEKEKLNDTAIALDGIAVIVNSENPTDGMTSEQIKSIFIGETTAWEEIK